jgi:predicted flap endonuclease-1-like 5' DNA nuclease
MAQEAFQENDVEWALKISKNGLKQAKLQKSNEWIDKFNSLNTNISQDQSDSRLSSQDTSLLSSIKKENIRIIKGIGPKVAEKLKTIGIHTVADLMHMSPEKIARVPGIGFKTAQKFISNAEEHTQMKKLNDFSEITDKDYDISREEAIIEEKSPVKVRKISTLKSMGREVEDNSQPDPSIKNENYLYSNFNNDKINESDGEIENYDENTDLTEPEESFEVNKPPQLQQKVVIPPEVVRQSNLTLQDKNTEFKEGLSRTIVKESLRQIIKDLKLSGFSIIEKQPNIQSIFTGIDLLAIKNVRVKEFLDLIYIIPIKMCSLKGSIIVSRENIHYNPINNSEDNSFQIEKLAQSYLKHLSNAKMALYSDLVSEATMLRFLSRYLNRSIKLEKSITKRNLFFRSGPIQYKILIEPLLVCQNTVGFTEKVIPFAYQQNSNIHIIEQSKFADLLQYIDQKYFLIESYSEEKNAVILDFEATNVFVRNVRKYSVPFIAYGFAIIIVLLTLTYSALPILINLGYGVVSLYIIVVAYLYLKLYKEKSALSQEFATPYYQKILNFDEGTFLLIKEELSSKLMDQFIYECVGKNPKYNFLEKLEADNAERFIEERVQHKIIEESNIFEQEILINPTQMENSSQKEENDPRVKDKYVDKYSSFLED